MGFKHIKIKKFNIIFVFHYKYGKKVDKLTYISMWRKWELGLFYKRGLMVSNKDFNKSRKWSNNLVYSYMIGVNLLL